MIVQQSHLVHAQGLVGHGQVAVGRGLAHAVVHLGGQLVSLAVFYLPFEESSAIQRRINLAFTGSQRLPINLGEYPV